MEKAKSLKKSVKSKFKSHIWNLTVKNIKTMFRDKSQLIWIFGYPLFFLTIFFIAFGTPESQGAYNVVIINNDSDDVIDPKTSPFSNASYILIDVLESDDLEDYIHVEGVDDYKYDEAYELLKYERIDAIIEIDEDFSEAIYGIYGEDSPKVDITTIPDEVVEGVIHSIVSQIVDEIQLHVNNVSASDIDTEQCGDFVELTWFDYMAPGMIVGSVLVVISQFSSHFAEEKEKGTLKRLSTTPVAKRDILLSGMLSQMVIAFIQICLTIVISAWVFDAYIHPEANLFLLILIPMLFVFTALGFGLILASFVKTYGSASALSWAIILPLQFLGGIYFSIDNPFSDFIPTTYAVHAMRVVQISGQCTWEAIGIDIMVLLGFGILSTIIGIILFYRKTSIL